MAQIFLDLDAESSIFQECMKKVSPGKISILLMLINYFTGSCIHFLISSP